LVQALSLISKAKENSSEVIAVIPYMGYARQDREFLPGEIVTMKVLGKLFKGAGASKIIVVDIHSLIGFKHFSIKTKNVTAIPDLVGYFKKLSLKKSFNYITRSRWKRTSKRIRKRIQFRLYRIRETRDRKQVK
jgi:Phosphoribosylpyrophosphate synthetase